MDFFTAGIMDRCAGCVGGLGAGLRISSVDSRASVSARMVHGREAA